MAFNKQLLKSANAGGSIPLVKFFIYGTDAVDDISTIIASGYFDSLVTSDYPLRVNDLFYIQATDDQGFYKITAITPNVTVAAI